ncbi:hypothetical protein [Nocardia asteroides]|uniref:Pepco domain-containing protein n=1 Tax=Nocardia asteroides TaxID=1824 RepID=UPI001E2BDDAC|nr:hypothetical protein [Nocardia asteroides]UGT61881.1 hypothetical protein LTT61_00550 [Nocardia asteroides]
MTAADDRPASGDAPGVISIFGREDTDGRADRSLFKRGDDFRYGRSEIPVELFRERVLDFMETIRDVVAGIPGTAGEYSLQEVQVNIEVSAKGQLSLLGTGGELSGKGGLTFTFRK